MIGDSIGNISTIIVVVLAIAGAHYSLSKHNTNNNINEFHEWLSKILENSLIHHISRNIGKKLAGIKSDVWLAFSSVCVAIIYLIISWIAFGIPDYNDSIDGILLIVVGISLISAAYATGALVGRLQKVGSEVSSELSDTANYTKLSKLILSLIFIISFIGSAVIVFDSLLTALILSVAVGVIWIADFFVGKAAQRGWI